MLRGNFRRFGCICYLVIIADLEDEESTFGAEGERYRKDEVTLTRMTLTDSMVLHPEQQNKALVPAAETSVTSTSFSRTQMSCGFPKAYQTDSGASSEVASLASLSRMSSRYGSHASLASIGSPHHTGASAPTAYQQMPQSRPTSRISSHR